MAGLRLPSASDYDQVIARAVLYTDEHVAWREKRENQDNWIAELELLGSDIGFNFLIRILASKWIPGDFGISLVCANRIQVRRLDVGHRHTNPSGCSGLRQQLGPHFHMWRDRNEDHCAVPIGNADDDIEVCEYAFRVFLRETGITWTGSWNDFPAANPRLAGM